MKKVKICIAQLEVIPRQPFINAHNGCGAITKAYNDGADIVVLSEMFIPGYLIGDHWERPAFLRDCDSALDVVIEHSKLYPDLTIVLGTVRTDDALKNEDGRIRKYNRAVVIRGGVIINEITKTNQPNYREFDDSRHFYSNRSLAQDTDNRWPSFEDSTFTLTADGKKIFVGVVLCEDGWDEDYTISPIHQMADNVDFIINISCSPYTFGKNSKRNRVFGAHAKHNSTPLVYVNNVGIQNNGKNVYTWDGNSCVYDKMGKQLNDWAPFEEFVQTVEIDLDASFGEDESFEENEATLWNAMVYGTTKFCERLGIKRVVIGASGGVDSCVSAVLFCKVLGKENVILVNMPSRHNSDLTKNAAKKLSDNLGTKYVIVPVEDSVKLTIEQLKAVGYSLTEFMLQNVQARDRSSRILAAIASAEKAVFTCNANKTETVIGYTTLYGDLGGFFAPLMDLWKGQVYAIARHINAVYGNPIPSESIDVKPSAELSDSQDVTKGLGDPLNYPYHDKLFASWVERWNRATPEDCLEWYMNGTLAKELGYEESFNTPIEKLFPTVKEFIDDMEQWWNLYDGFAVAKRIQGPPGLSLSRRAVGYDHRETQEPPYYSHKYLGLRKRLIGR